MANDERNGGRRKGGLFEPIEDFIARQEAEKAAASGAPAAPTGPAAPPPTGSKLEPAEDGTASAAVASSAVAVPAAADAARKPVVVTVEDSDDTDTPEKAYAAAERAIAEAQASHATELRVQYRLLERLPSSIAGLTALRSLSLDRTRVADLRPLAGLTALQVLSLAGTRVADLAPLAGLTALQHLWLDGTGVADLRPLAGLAALRSLWLGGTRVADLAPLRGMTAMLDAAQKASEHMQDFYGLQFKDAAIVKRSPFGQLAALENPARTVETINYVRHLEGLPPHIPEGYQSPPDIAALLAGLEKPPGPGIDPPPSLPTPGPFARFARNDGGPIDIYRGELLAPAERDRLPVLQEELLEALEELLPLTEVSNGYRDIVPSLRRYRAALKRPTTELRDGDIDVLFMRGIRVQAAYEELQKLIDAGNAPEEDRRLLAPMRVLLAGHGPFLQATNRGLQLYEQADRDRRRLAEELELKEKQLKLEVPLVAEAGATTTEEATAERRDAAEAMGKEPQPERANTAGRHAIRNYLIEFASLARRWAAWAQRETSDPQKLARWVSAQAARGAAVGAAALAFKGSAVGQIVGAAGSAAIDAAFGSGGMLAATATDFMLRHATELKDLARAGGASFDWLVTFVDWLVDAVRGIGEKIEQSKPKSGDER